MGSLTGSLPEATASSLTLTHPTEQEKESTWKLNHGEWGGPLNLADYLQREPYIASLPLSANGGMTYWILTDSTAPSESRPVLSSVESLRKRALVATPDGRLEEVTAFGVGSVYTNPKFRGHRYASRMLGELGVKLQTWSCKDGEKAGFSALWSDIGKTFYAKKGWKAFPSTHVAFPVTSAVESKARAITYDNLQAFCELDEKLLRQKLAQPTTSSKTRAAIVADFDQMRWHLHREDFICARVFTSDSDERGKPQIKGAVAGVDGRRVWAIWIRNYSDGVDRPDKNKLYILRLVIEDETAPQEEVMAAFKDVIWLAQKEAAKGALSKVDMWNPDPVLRDIVEKSGMSQEWVERENDSIPSLMWYGEGSTDAIEWVANEKYCWC